MENQLKKAVLASAAAVASMAAALALTAAPASAATGTHLNGWADTCNHTTWAYGCLYYNAWGGGGIFNSSVYWDEIPKGEPFDTGGSGLILYVRNNAASIGSATKTCGATTWVYPYSGGDWNWVSAGRGGNLTSALHNNEASFDPAAGCA